jgi:2,3-bisphosphoglycerate-dependent phosphoglycerate mutase
MKQACFLAAIFVAIILSCSMKTTPDARVASIQADGKVIFRDGTSKAIIGYADSSNWVIIAVRHCEKAKDQGSDPNLSAEGQARAEKLGQILKPSGLDAIYTTRFKRTQQTGEAVFRQCGQPPMDTIDFSAQDIWADSMRASHIGKQVLFVGHQNTVPRLLNHLVGQPTYQNIPDEEFGRLYLVLVSQLRPTVVYEFQY